MPQTYKVSFFIILGLVFLAPLFFIPGSMFYLDSAKTALLVFAVVLSGAAYIFESWRRGSISLPKHYFILVIALLPIVYLFSALLTTPSSLSLLGYSMEVGTFGYMLLGTIALLLAGSFSFETTRFLQVLSGLFASLSILALFVFVKILSGGTWFVFGNFGGNMGNPLGMWTDLAMVFGLLSVIAALAIGMIPMRPLIKTGVYLVFLLATILLVVINFSTAFGLVLAASVLLFFYFSRIEKHFYFHSKGQGEAKGNVFARPTFLPILLGVISLLFLINPNISETRGNLGNVVSSSFGVENTDIRPTLSATLGISKAVLSQAGLFGSGPNTFGQDWHIFRPLTVNATPFWGVSFPGGVGFIPTQIATTGVLGTALWIAFFVFLAIFAVKTLTHVPESRAGRFITVSVLFVTLFLWIASLLYTPSAAVMILAFIFTGFLIALLRDKNLIGSYHVDLRSTTPAGLVATSLALVAFVGILFFGSIGFEKTIAAYHYKKAVNLSNTEGALISDVESELGKAAELDPVDIHFTAISRLNFSRAQVAANAATGTPEENRALFEESLRRSIAAARAAVSANPAGFQNWVNLGTVYSSIVPEPLKVEGAYENAQFAFLEAVKRNPNNPELPLLLAQLEINKGDADAARSYIRSSIALKEDYADAYLLLAQLEVQEDNIPGAIASTEALAVLAPENAGVHFELGVLKYTSEDYAGAATSLEEAVKLVPDYANAKYYLALTYVQLGRKDEARNQLEDILVGNPDSAEVKALLDEINKPVTPARR